MGQGKFDFVTEKAPKEAVRSDIGMDGTPRSESFESVSVVAPTWAVTKKEAKNFFPYACSNILLRPSRTQDCISEQIVATIKIVTLSSSFLATIVASRAGSLKDAARRFAVAFGHP